MAFCSEASKKWMYLVNHVFLPPKLPQENDTHGDHEYFLATKVFKSLKDFSTTQKDAEPSVVRALQAAMDATANVVAVHNFTAANRDITVIGNELLKQFQPLLGNDNELVGIFPIPVKVSDQNAGIFMYRLDDSIRFEMFELVPMEQLDDDFLVSICNTIQRMSGQVAHGTSPTQKKANQSHDETREPGIKKHTRDEVLWKDCLLPWRRSSLWLLMRVSIQLALVRSGLPAVEASSLYKQFMLFFTANTLAEASKVLQSDTNCLEWTDLVYAMKAKVSRRLHKLDARLSRPLESRISTAMKNATVLLKAHWQAVRDKEREADSARVSAAGLAELDFEKDTRAYLPAVDRFIQTISERGGEAMGQLFQPQCPLVDTKEGKPWEMLSTGKEKVFCASTLDRCSVMMTELGGASATINSTDETTRICFEAMQSHSSPAASSATHNPEAWSLMVLGVLELWVVCDRAATKECPLLLTYDPCIDPDHFQVLLLPFRSQMERLAKVEEYVRGRSFGASQPCPWTGFGQADSFAAKYVDLSSKHQDLLRSIQKEATECQERKREEFRTKLAQHNSLMSQYYAAACEYYTEIVDDDEYIKHKGGCKNVPCYGRHRGWRFTYSSGHSSKEASAKAVVFELQIPHWYAIWRQATNFVIFDILNHDYTSGAKPERVYLLSADVHLQKHFSAPPQRLGGRRIGLGSQAKANYQYFDESVSRFVGKIDSASQITATADSATYKLPAVSRALQVYLMRPPASPDGPSPNTVLASQHSCPDHMSLNEYKALCSIPLGHRIQWQNLLAQVTAPCVDFRKIETAQVVLQCMYQAGPCTDDLRWYRDSHSIPVFEDRFCETMLASLGEATAKIEDNWQCIHELSTYIMARIIAWDWIKVLKDRVNDTISDEGKISLRAKVAHAALVHADSFNLDDKLANGQSVLHLILKEDSNAADFIKSCITIQESYSENCCTDALQPMLHWRWQLLCARTCDILYSLIADRSRSCLDDAIEFSWAAYRPSGEGWRSAVDKTWCSHGQRTWLTTKSGSQNGTGDAMVVHYCLVTGELRVNGYPLNRLPASYENHAMYKRLFGRTAIEVMPGCYPGLGFSGKKLHMGHEVHFGSSGPEQGPSRHHLLVRAIKGGKTWEFIEPGLFTGFPTEFVDNYVHWYDMESNIIEFRPVKEPWSTSQDNWSKSRTSGLLSRLLGPLVDVSDLHLIYHPTLQVLDMELPKLKLSFTLQEGTSTVASSQFRGMVIDANQAIDTLVGFQNKLVLCSSHSDFMTRKVLLAEGPITSQMSRMHVSSFINKSHVVRAHAYDVDPQLCRLVDNGSLESKLFLCHIHALTSFCLPDPLTMHTGTETALDILRSAAVKSFVLFSQETLFKLGQIASNVGFMAQHPGFLGAVTALFQAAAERKFFYREQYLEPPRFDKHKDRLIARDEMRTSCFRISRYGAEKHDTTLDKTYTSRDKGQESARAQRAFDIAQYVFSEREAPAFDISNNGTAAHIWKFLEKRLANWCTGHLKGRNLA
ncbi:unnamed protein product [Parascedosporium putredinis]|uniref:DUF6606 domain-containing protein n=1 Tax=Parascedosporium putredinis TaxID=1442378 RepID=A0A9P1H163_9PEZI|nr:unnamed protein product [Parascedosporium putredinis]CAI7993450.1 unnamed protein product [Parascedosporium putredinis]